MRIDIIEYTDEQLAMLTVDALDEVRSAQREKDKLTERLRETLDQEKRSLVDRGIFTSTIWGKRKAELTADYQKDVETVRESLVFFLHYLTMQGVPEVPTEVPYTVDYALNVEERMKIVRDYYLFTYDDPVARFAKFKEDWFAKTYLGELYQSLYHYLEDFAD